MNSFNLDLKNCVGMTRDNAPNITKAFEAEQFVNIFNFPCACHSLNLLFNEVYKKHATVALMVKMADKIRMLFANTNERRKLLSSEQKKIGLPQVAFPCPNVTRWWSLHFVLAYLLENHQAISNAFADFKLFKKDEICSYTIEFLTTVCALNVLGAEVYETSNAMESDSQPTVSLIIPFVFNFFKKLESEEKNIVILKAQELCKVYFSVVETQEVKKHVETVFTAFKNCFLDFQKKYLGSKYYDNLAISTLLDPRFFKNTFN